MAKKMKIKLKPGKAKIKLKSDGDTLPLDGIAVDKLLGKTLEHVALRHQRELPRGLIYEREGRMQAKPEADED